MDSESLPSDALVFGELDQDDFLALAHISGSKLLRTGYKGNYVAHYLFSTHREKHRKYWTKSVNLSELTSKFPPELFLLILGFLHPIDLYHFIQTTRGFRNLLLRKDSSAIWRNSFLAHPDIPCSPEDTPPPKWVSLLFGPATCDQCGRFYTLVDFAYRERKCIQCHSLELFYPNDYLLSSVEHIIQKYPKIEDAIWRISRKTFKTITAYRYPSSNDYEWTTPKYSRKDAVKMANKLFDFLEASSEDSHQAFRQFVQEHEALAEHYMEYVIKCESWSNGIYLRCKSHYESCFSRALTTGHNILARLGYDEQDISYAHEQITLISITAWSHSKAYKLSRSATRKLLIEFENLVRREEIAREEKLGKAAYDLRVYVTSARYKKIASQYLKPEPSSFVPNYRPILDWPIIQEYVKDKAYEHAHEQDFPEDSGVQEQIVHYVTNVIEGRKRTLAELVHSADFVSPQQLSDSTNVSVLNLTIALFEKSCDRYSLRGRNQILIGWGDAGKDNWWCYDQTDHAVQYPIGTYEHPPPHLKYSAIGRQALEVIAALVGMDLSSTRAEDFDSLNYRFFCKTCAFTRKHSVFGLDAMNWRECLQHTFAAQGVHYGTLAHCHVPSFDVASSDLTKSILFLEKPWPYGWEEAWFCRHCSDFPRECCTRPEVVLHVREVHGVRKPVSGTDILYEPPLGHETKREMLFVGFAQVSNHRCLRCPADTKSLRLWRLEDVRRHLVDAHNVLLDEQNERVDWEKIKPVADEAWIKKAYGHAESGEAGQATSW